MKKGFVTSWYYPPGNSSEGLVTFKLLRSSKFKYDVWTRADQRQSVWDRKSDESKLTADNVNIVKCDCDGMKDWVRQGVEYFVKHRNEYDFIMSRSMPVESHEIAIKIKRKFPDVKWIASFGDPIVDTPYVNAITMDEEKNPYKISGYFGREKISVLRTPRLIISPVRQARKYLWKHDKNNGSKISKYFRSVNTAVLEGADAIIYNNSYQVEHAFMTDVSKKYRNKANILEHSFDTDLYPKEKQKIKSGKISFIYVGHLDDTRNASSLFEAVRKLKKHDKNLRNKVEFTFYGHLSDRDKLFVLDNNLVDLIKIKDDIKYIDSLKVIKNADWAILIDANFTRLVDDCIYLPAKLIDYIGAGTNVFSISHRRGAGADIIRDIGGGIVVTHSPDDIYLYLSKIIYHGYAPKPYDERKRQKYSSARMSKGLDKIIREVIES